MWCCCDTSRCHGVVVTHGAVMRAAECVGTSPALLYAVARAPSFGQCVGGLGMREYHNQPLTFSTDHPMPLPPSLPLLFATG